MTQELKRILGLDVGDRRIGIALSDALGLTAQPLTVLERRSAAADLNTICALVESHDVRLIVIGLPLTLRGEQGIQADKVTAFVRGLERRLSVPVRLVDERMTTVQGQRALREMGASHRKQKPVIDQVAAQLILQQFLDMQPREPAS